MNPRVALKEVERVVVMLPTGEDLEIAALEGGVCELFAIKV